jgi:3-dehydroquinate synthase
MSNYFTIENEKFYFTNNLEKNFVVKSFPHPYKVIFDKLPESFKENEVVLVDNNVRKLYNINHKNIIEFEATENNKCLESTLKISRQLSEINFNKSNTLVVIGGGITQDVGAFVSKMFKRGIKWKLYPTTLLSMCDSCIGGKACLNLDSFKNQLSVFSTPEEVIIDINFLKTLSKNDILSGKGEMLKLFVIGGDYFLSKINSDYETLIRNCLEIKKNVIEYDEFETNIRKSLNYGHTFGHIIESMTDYSIAHGEAVLLGMYIINELFNKNEKIKSLINDFTSISKIKHLKMNEIMNKIKTDKKVQGDIITLITVNTPGNTSFKKINLAENLNLEGVLE